MVQIKQKLVPSSKYKVKCPNVMQAEYITFHNTANDASAENEIAYMTRNNNQISYHFAVDDKEIIQGIPLNRNAWHCGDGSNGKGNRKSIGVEVCYSKSGGERYRKAEKLAIKLIAQLLHERNWGINRVKKHQDWSGKYCPHRVLAEGRWNEVLKEIQIELDNLNGKVTIQSAKTYLEKGDKGAKVKELQEKLLKAGYKLPKYGADSDYGQETVDSVKELQKKHGLTVDGIYGKRSEEALDKELAKLEGELTVSQAKQLQEQIDELKKELAKKVNEPERGTTPSDWAIEEWKRAVISGYFDGDDPKRFLTKEQAAKVVNKQADKIREYITDPLEKRIEELEKEVAELKVKHK